MTGNVHAGDHTEARVAVALDLERHEAAALGRALSNHVRQYSSVERARTVLPVTPNLGTAGVRFQSLKQTDSSRARNLAFGTLSDETDRRTPCGLVVTSVPKVPIWKVFIFSILQ